MHLQVKENIILILLLVSACSCMRKVVKARLRDKSLKALKNNTALKESFIHTERVEKGLRSKLDIERNATFSQHYQVLVRSPKALIRDRILGNFSRQRRSSVGRIRISPRTEKNYQIKFPKGFSPPEAPFNPLLYPFPTATLSVSSKITEPWKPITYTEESAPKDESLNPIQLDSLREAIIYGLPKLNDNWESTEKKSGFVTDISTVKLHNLVLGMESSAITDKHEDNFELLASGRDKIDLLMQPIERTTEVFHSLREKEIVFDGSNLNIEETNFTETADNSGTEHLFPSEEFEVPLSVGVSASSKLNDIDRKLNQTTWPLSSSEEKIFSYSSISAIPKNNREDYSLNTQKTDSYMNNVESSVSHHTVKLNKPFSDNTAQNEPKICIPMHFKETSSTGSDEVTDVERIYCFQLPPEFKINFNSVSEPATVQIVQDHLINNGLISNGKRFTINIILLVTAWMVFILTKRLQHF